MKKQRYELSIEKLYIYIYTVYHKNEYIPHIFADI